MAPFPSVNPVWASGSDLRKLLPPNGIYQAEAANSGSAHCLAITREHAGLRIDR